MEELKLIYAEAKKQLNEGISYSALARLEKAINTKYGRDGRILLVIEFIRATPNTAPGLKIAERAKRWVYDQGGRGFINL